MPAATAQHTEPVQYMQGIAVPASSVNPTEFFARTRRHTYLERAVAYTGQAQDVFELRKSDVLAGILLNFTGQVVVTPGSGSVATTARWPYDLLKSVRFTANGASNLINCSGLKLKARDMMKRGDLNDASSPQSAGGKSLTSGSLALPCESWGVGSGATAIPAGTYQIELQWFVPVAEDEVDLAGAIFLATSSSDLTLTVDWAQPSELFTLTGAATAALTGNLSVTSVKYSIPMGGNGQIVVPDLSMFHSLIQSRTTAIQVGENEIRLVGQGAGKSLLRAYYQVWNGTPNAPLPMTAANYGKQSWRFGNNETPDEYFSGTVMRTINARAYNSDIGAWWGFGCFDFAHENAFRDVVDMGAAGELRLVPTIANGVTLTNAAIEYCTETIFRAGQSA